MPKLNSTQANDLANQFLALAQAIGDFHYRHWADISKAQHKKLAAQHSLILQSGEDMLALSTTLVMEDAANSLELIKVVTQKVKSSLKTLEKIQTGIDITAIVVTLGAAVAAKNPGAITIAVEQLATKMNVKL